MLLLLYTDFFLVKKVPKLFVNVLLLLFFFFFDAVMLVKDTDGMASRVDSNHTVPLAY